MIPLAAHHGHAVVVVQTAVSVQDVLEHRLVFGEAVVVQDVMFLTKHILFAHEANVAVVFAGIWLKAALSVCPRQYMQGKRQ